MNYFMNSLVVGKMRSKEKKEVKPKSKLEIVDEEKENLNRDSQLCEEDEMME